MERRNSTSPKRPSLSPTSRRASKLKTILIDSEENLAAIDDAGDDEFEAVAVLGEEDDDASESEESDNVEDDTILEEEEEEEDEGGCAAIDDAGTDSESEESDSDKEKEDNHAKKKKVKRGKQMGGKVKVIPAKDVSMVQSARTSTIIPPLSSRGSILRFSSLRSRAASTIQDTVGTEGTAALTMALRPSKPSQPSEPSSSSKNAEMSTRKAKGIQKVQFGSVIATSSAFGVSSKTLSAAAKNLPRYNRQSYHMASIKPLDSRNQTKSAPSTPATTKLAATPHQASPRSATAVYERIYTPQGTKRTKFPSNTGSVPKKLELGYIPPPSSGLAYVPISEQHKHPTLSQPEKHQLHIRTHSSQGSVAGSLTSWQSHARRMEYNEYVRSVSRQSTEEVKIRAKKIEDEARAAAEALLVPVMPNIETVVVEAERTATMKTYKEYRREKRLERDLEEAGGSAYQLSLFPTSSLNQITESEQLSRHQEGQESNVGSQTLLLPSNQPDVIIVEPAFEAKPGGAASGAPSTPFTVMTQSLSIQSRYRQGGISISDRNPTPSPGDLVLGRRGSLHAIPTSSKLTESEINLFTLTTGQFRGGQRDPHARFLRRNLRGLKLSGPNMGIPHDISNTYYQAEKKVIERAKNDFVSRHSKRIQGAQAMREHEWAVAKNKYTVESGVEGGLFSGVMRDEKDEKNVAVEQYQLRLLKVSNPEKYKRYIEREKSKSFLLGKYEVLEQLRIQIVSKTASLKHYHEYFDNIKRENIELKEKHHEASQRVNQLISKTLDENESCNLDIVRIDRERKRQLKILENTFEEFTAKSESYIGKLEFKANMTRQTVDRITEEIAKLIEFKSLKESNPTAIADRIKHAVREKEIHADYKAEELERIKSEWQADQAEIEATWMSKVQALIDNMGDSLKVTVASSRLENYTQNGRLTHEIGIHKAQTTKTEKEIAALLEERKKLAEKEGQVQDKRRNVLDLKNQMSCTPDMEFEIQPRNLLIKELGV